MMIGRNRLWRTRAALALLAALAGGWAPGAQALHLVSEQIPDGTIHVAPDARTSLYLDIEGGDWLQWTWTEQAGKQAALSTQLIWTDANGKDHELPSLPVGQTFGNFDGPRDMIGARLVWTNTGAQSARVEWAYFTTAPFWHRPDYFLPAMLPLFLVAAAYYFGRVIDRRNKPPSGGTPLRAAPQLKTEERLA